MPISQRQPGRAQDDRLALVIGALFVGFFIGIYAVGLFALLSSAALADLMLRLTPIPLGREEHAKH